MKKNVTTIFNKTLEKTQSWLRDLMQELNWQDEHKAYLALRAVLRALRDRLTVEETAQLGAQLPMLVRGFYFEGWDPTGKPVKERHLEQFLGRVGSYFKEDERVIPEEVARAVFKILSKHITEGEIRDVKRVIPGELRMLWPEERRSQPPE
jgi:uncharacterized protein (DUF2267 family)